jgi:hypothetical protein
MHWQSEYITHTFSPLFRAALVSRIYTNGTQPAASGAIFPDAPSSIPNIGAEFLPFALKFVEV